MILALARPVAGLVLTSIRVRDEPRERTAGVCVANGILQLQFMCSPATSLPPPPVAPPPPVPDPPPVSPDPPPVAGSTLHPITLFFLTENRSVASSVSTVTLIGFLGVGLHLAVA